MYASLSLITDRMTRQNISKCMEDFNDIINYFDLFDLSHVYIALINNRHPIEKNRHFFQSHIN